MVTAVVLSLPQGMPLKPENQIIWLIESSHRGTCWIWSSTWQREASSRAEEGSCKGEEDQTCSGRGMCWAEEDVGADLLLKRVFGKLVTTLKSCCYLAHLCVAIGVVCSLMCCVHGRRGEGKMLPLINPAAFLSSDVLRFPLRRKGATLPALPPIHNKAGSILSPALLPSSLNTFTALTSSSSHVPLETPWAATPQTRVTE